MGELYLVGAGPGPAGLLTVRGASLLSRAGHVVHDPQVPAELLTLAAAGAVVLEALTSAATEAERTGRLAAAGGVVVRLFAGDGVTSGRAGEEMRRLRASGVPWEVVVGVSAEAAAMAFAGVGGKSGTLAVRLERAPGAEDTSVPLLTVRRATDAASAARTLLATGASADTPAVVVQRAGTPAQEVATTTLARLAEGGEVGKAEGVLVAAAGVAERSAWFEGNALFGRHIVVTRPRAQSSELVEWLEAQGAQAVLFPAIRIVAPADSRPLAAAAAAVHTYDWLVFTSVNGVEWFWAALSEAGLDTRALGSARVAAIGPATAAALRARGVVPDVIPERYVAESVVEALAGENLRGRRVLLARAAGAREVLPRRLEELGASVTEVEAYRSVPDTGPADELRARLVAGEIDAVTFTSSSTVQNFVAAVGTELGGAAVVCIGPVTAATARDLGLPVTAVAPAHTVAGLEAALLEHLAGRGK